MVARKISTVILPLFLLAAPLLGASAQVLDSPPWSTAAASSGWARLVPNLSATAAAAKVAPLQALGEREFLEKAYGLILLRDPEIAYGYGISKAYGVPEDELSDLSDEQALGTRQLYLAIGKEVDRRVSEARGKAVKESVALAAFSRWLRDKEKDIEFSLDKYPVSPYVNSLDQLSIQYFTEYRSMRDASDAERYIACLGKLPAKMAGLAAALDLRAKAGVVLPRGIYEFTLRGIREIANASPESNPFYETFARKLAASSVPEGAAREALLSKAASACERYAIPAWKDLLRALERQGGAVPAEGGAWRLPGGGEYYASCLTRLTTTDLSAAEIHEIGKRELARVQAEIRADFALLGYPKEQSLSQLYTRLGRDSGSLSGRGLLSRIDSLIEGMDGRLDKVVAIRPRIGVEAVFGEFGGYYQPPSADGSRPGRYFVASGDRRYAYDVATTAYHETLPGHHLQIARAIQADLPGFLRGADFLGYTEGWALYAERIAFEMGAYDKDPSGDLGRLRMEALRAARLVADTGLNAMGWSFSKTIAFLRENTGLEEGMIQSDASRYVIDPGQATAYYSGFVEMLALRERCRAALGPKYDVRRFHEAVLGGGALPLSLLGRVIDEFIAAEKAR